MTKEGLSKRIHLKNEAWSLLDWLGSYVGLSGTQLATQMVNVNLIQAIKPDVTKKLK